MAFRSRATTVSERPRTSSGPNTSSNSFENLNFDKRVSRDDLSLVLKGRGRGNVRQHQIPVRGRLPSPDTSPRSELLSRVTLVRTTSPESLSERDTGVVAIGMALGSPSQAPDNAPAPWRPVRTMVTPTDFPDPVDDSQAKPKPRKWGLFGRSKSKRGRPEHLAQRSMTDQPHTSNTSLSSGSGSTTTLQKHKPIVIRSRTDPPASQHGEGKTSREVIRKSSPRPNRLDSKTKRFEERPPSQIPPVPILSEALLNIEIPNVKMDRYSVMFGDVLQQPQPTLPLLARRQATLDRLKPINNNLAQAKGEEATRLRRASSPQPKSSPTFLLFPNSPDTPVVMPAIAQTIKQPPRMRSNTSPATLPSPCAATFEEAAKPRKEPLRARVIQIGAAKDTNRDTKVPPVPRVHPQLVSKFSKKPPVKPLAVKQPSPFTPDTSSLILDSPTSPEDEEMEIQIKDKLKPTITEPAWEMVSPPTSTASSSPMRAKKPTPPSSVASPNIQSIDKAVEISPDEALRNAVEVSIARQISVSHQQRKMLRPLQEGIDRRRRRDAANTSPVPGLPLNAIHVGKNERLAQTKTATPILVHPEDMMDNMRGNIYRNSERIVLDGP